MRTSEPIQVCRLALKTLLILCVVYAATWFAGYIAVIGFDFRFVPEYFLLGWSGGGELPAFIQLLAIMTSGVTLIIVAIVWRLRRRKSS